MIKTKGLNKMFKNVKTLWISLLDPLQRIFSKYMPFLDKMFLDNSSNYKLIRSPFLLSFDLLDLTLLKNVGNDIDDLVQFDMILLL